MNDKTLAGSSKDHDTPTDLKTGVVQAISLLNLARSNLNPCKLQEVSIVKRQLAEVARDLTALLSTEFETGGLLQEWRDNCHCGCDACIRLVETLGLRHTSEKGRARCKCGSPTSRGVHSQAECFSDSSTQKARVVPSVCGKPMPNGQGTGQCINVPGHEGECDDMPL